MNTNQSPAQIKTLLCGCREDRPCDTHAAPKLESLIPLVPDFTEHVSIKCANCNARLEFNFTEEQDEASELDYARHQAGWSYTQDGLSCDVCSRETIEIARLDTRPAYSKPWMIR